jgi:hypothetical protein
MRAKVGIKIGALANATAFWLSPFTRLLVLEAGQDCAHCAGSGACGIATPECGQGWKVK